MEQILYGDVLFFVNFTMDFLTLFVTGRILNRKIKPGRLAAAAAIGAVYGVAACFIESILLMQLFINLAISLLMCYVAYEKRILPACALFYTSGALLGGFMTAIYNFAGVSDGGKTVYVDGKYVALADNVPLGWTVVLAVLIGACAIAAGKYRQRRSEAREISFTVLSDGKSISFCGMTDSGNLLTDPISGRPVIIMSRDAILKVLPDGIREVFISNDTSLIQDLSFELSRKIRLIPSSSVGGEKLLLCYIPDSLTVNGAERSALLACSDKCQSFGKLDALLPPSLCGG